MAEKTSKKKIIKYRKYLGLNIGTVLFGIVFVYMIVCMVLYLTSSHIAPYEVTKGTLSGNYKYTALALKSESIIEAPESGSVTYYAREGTEIATNGIICSVMKPEKQQRSHPSHPRKQLFQHFPLIPKRMVLFQNRRVQEKLLQKKPKQFLHLLPIRYLESFLLRTQKSYVRLHPVIL